MTMGGDATDLSLAGRVVAVLGGDGREAEIARALVEVGAEVRVCGTPLDDGIAGVIPFRTVAETTRGAEIVICPIPFPQADGSLYAPAADQPVVVDAESLAGMHRGGLLITGKASTQMHQAASRLELRLREYESQEDLMLLRAPAIAEGAIRTAIEHTDVTLHSNRCLVVGFGKIGPVLAVTLRGLAARVTVAARNPVQRARAYALGCDPVPLDDLPSIVPHMVVIFNTAPARLFTRRLLEHVGQQTVLIDLSAPQAEWTSTPRGNWECGRFGREGWAAGLREQSAGASGWEFAGLSERSSARKGRVRDRAVIPPIDPESLSWAPWVRVAFAHQEHCGRTRPSCGDHDFVRPPAPSGPLGAPASPSP